MEKSQLAVSSLTSKFQATIPANIRKLLKLKAGDKVGFKIIEDGNVVLKRVPSMGTSYLAALEATLTEWNSPEDEEAFSEL